MPDDQMIEEVFPVDQLGRHLASRGDPQAWYVGKFVECMAAAILADPQAHIDALVDAGVLKKYADSVVYTVVAPHVHDWRVSNSTTVVNPGDTVILRCGCGEKYNVENRLPIEAPDA